MGIDSAGTVLETDHSQWGAATAIFDPRRIYRYSLSRAWDSKGSRVAWIMLNPSTATASELDPTINRILRFSREWGHGSAEVVNLFALRATDPLELADHRDPVGPVNDEAIATAVVGANQAIAAWGIHGTLMGRDLAVTRLLTSLRAEIAVLGLTKDGHPRHPLYVPRLAKPSRWFPGIG